MQKNKEKILLRIRTFSVSNWTYSCREPNNWNCCRHMESNAPLIEILWCCCCECSFWFEKLKFNYRWKMYFETEKIPYAVSYCCSIFHWFGCTRVVYTWVAHFDAFKTKQGWMIDNLNQYELFLNTWNLQKINANSNWWTYIQFLRCVWRVCYAVVEWIYEKCSM